MTDTMEIVVDYNGITREHIHIDGLGMVTLAMKIEKLVNDGFVLIGHSPRQLLYARK